MWDGALSAILHGRFSTAVTHSNCTRSANERRGVGRKKDGGVIRGCGEGGVWVCAIWHCVCESLCQRLYQSLMTCHQFLSLCTISGDASAAISLWWRHLEPEFQVPTHTPRLSNCEQVTAVNHNVSLRFQITLFEVFMSYILQCTNRGNWEILPSALWLTITPSLTH